MLRVDSVVRIAEAFDLGLESGVTGGVPRRTQKLKNASSSCTDEKGPLGE